MVVSPIGNAASLWFALWFALWCALFAPEAYVRIHVEDMVSENRGPGTDVFYVDWPKTEASWRACAEAGRDGLRRRVIRSLATAVAIALVALVVGWFVGVVSVGRPLSIPRALGFAGVSLIGWATIFGLGTAAVTWGGVSLPELLTPKVFLVTFAPGTVMALVAGLM